MDTDRPACAAPSAPRTATPETQAVVAALGFTADIRALESWGLRVTERRLAVGTTMATSLVLIPVTYWLRPTGR